MTFWDAGEFITAAWGLGIPHPPGTPLYVALAHGWLLLLAPVLGAARAMNVLSALATAAAGGVTAWLFARERTRADATWCAVMAALCAGLMSSVWANATETEVYAIALLHAALMLASATKAGDVADEGARGWLWLTSYAMLLAPAVHLSTLVAGPAAIALAGRDAAGRWRWQRVLSLGGALVVAAGIGRVSPWLVAVGMLVAAASVFTVAPAPDAAPATASSSLRLTRRYRRWAGVVLPIAALSAIAASALLIMLVRARHDPGLNQGDPSTLGALADVVARRQYDVAGLWPRRAPAWLQLANVMEYVDWQAALGWGHGVFTTPARVTATVVFVLLAVAGARALRREARRLADAMLVLLVCGTFGVAVYLNMRPGASLGWGIVPDSVMHEARERDYFFVYGFWAWGCLAGCGAVALVRARRWPVSIALGAVALLLAGNWRAMNRRREPERDAARRVAHAILASAPRGAVLFLAGDNDSYPLWYAQQVEGLRTDVSTVTLPLLSARWYSSEIARRTGLRWASEEQVPGTTWRHEQQAALIARAARNAGRPVAASPMLLPGERALLGSGWALSGVDYRASRPAADTVAAASVDRQATLPWIPASPGRSVGRDVVDGAPGRMLEFLECPRLARPEALTPAERDSLEVRCNFR